MGNNGDFRFDYVFEQGCGKLFGDLRRIGTNLHELRSKSGIKLAYVDRAHIDLTTY